MALAPSWLETLSRLNPLTYLVDATRSLFVGDYAAAAVTSGVLVTAAVAVLLAWWGTRTFARSSA